MPVVVEHQKTMFEAEDMEDVSGEDWDGDEEKEVSVVVWPGVVKWGDENGERVGLRNVVCRIKVLCREDG